MPARPGAFTLDDRADDGDDDDEDDDDCDDDEEDDDDDGDDDDDDDDDAYMHALTHSLVTFNSRRVRLCFTSLHVTPCHAIPRRIIS